MTRRRPNAPARRLLVQGLLAGFCGTTAMTATSWAERRLRPDGPVDYDAGDAPVRAASTVLRIQPRTPAQRRALFALVHWGYGSLVGVGYVALLRRSRREPATGLAFLGALEAMALVLLPTLGETPPVREWPADVLGLSLVQHAVYTAATGLAAHRVAR